MLVATDAAKTKATVESFILGDMYLLARSAGALWKHQTPPSVRSQPLDHVSNVGCSETETAMNFQLSLDPKGVPGRCVPS